jgi:hypothetical protein
MGIRNAFKFLETYGVYHLSEFRGTTFVFDMMPYYVNAFKKNEKDWLKSIKLMMSMFISNGITCICVFDGPNKPKEKNLLIQRKKQKGKKYDKELGELISDISKIVDFDKQKAEKIWTYGIVNIIFLFG